MKEWLRKLWERIKDSFLIIFFIVGLISPIVCVLLWLSNDGWNILDVFILGIFILILIAE